VVQRYDVSEPAYTVLDCLLQGRPLGEALDAASSHWSGSDEELGQALQNWFRQWAEGEFFSGVLRQPA
jgi:hypothetical protein